MGGLQQDSLADLGQRLSVMSEWRKNRQMIERNDQVALSVVIHPVRGRITA